MITDMEIERLIAHWKKAADEVDDAPPWEKLLSEPEENEDESLIEKAVVIVRQSQRASASLLQRRLEIGYPRAARCWINSKRWVWSGLAGRRQGARCAGLAVG
ncbi:MAG: DNA translocase FtsK [Anaerolineales bacterium]